MYQSLGGGGSGGLKRGFFLPANRYSEPMDIFTFAEIPTVRPHLANGGRKPGKVGGYVVGRKIIGDVPLTRFV